MSKLLSESENSTPRTRPLLWLGVLMALTGPISHPAFFAQWAIFRDTTGWDILVLITAVILSALALRRTWTAGGTHPGCWRNHWMSALEGLRDSIEKLQEAGAAIIAIHPALPESHLAIARKLNLQLSVRSGPDLAMTKELGVVHGVGRPPPDFSDIPRPAVSIVQEGGGSGARLKNSAVFSYGRRREPALWLSTPKTERQFGHMERTT